MNLAEFIESQREAIVDEFAEQAKRLAGADSKLSMSELRNTAKELLFAMADDMRSAEDSIQQTAKSRGQRGEAPSHVRKLSHKHAAERLSQGFSLNDVISEFRALRAKVLRRWQEAQLLGPEALQEMVRFNEVIDEALTESVREYSRRTEELRALFSGVLAHDLRSPLSAITNSATYLLRDEHLSRNSRKAATGTHRGALRMKRMIDDLLDYTRTRLGEQLPMNSTD